MTRHAAYRASLYRAGAVAVRVGRRSASADRWLLRHGAAQGVFLTAWNPLSRPMPGRWNARAMAALRRALGPAAHETGEGALGRWREAMLLAALSRTAARRLARRFRQAAVVLVPRGRPARLLYIAGPRASPAPHAPA
ncbi:DUF3293 domain-containing protein [Rubritepida flocculans]|uniref:DUF3293 domain-containing protein n=1 Tax=Rubritepida flocculans TaxID=182403 RepID=UPI000412320A|nr:DUF3293 domain-containing protein [Rubritepida flocculans]